jgi:hypothetical protein
MAYEPTDAELAYQVTGPGQVVTRTPAQVAAYRQQLKGGAATSNALLEAMSRSNPFSVPTMAAPTTAAPVMDTSNRFEPALADSQNRLTSLLDNPDSINQSAAYKFRMGQGMEALQRSLGAKGLLNSGNRLAAMTDYAQGQASQEYGAQWDRLKGLNDSNSQGWLGDKNANTASFSAQSQNWLGDRNANTNAFTAQSGAYNTAQRNNDVNSLGWGSLYQDSQRPGATTTGRGYSAVTGGYNPGGISGYTPVDWSSVQSNSPWGQSLALQNY